MEEREKREQLKQWIQESENVVFFGAGSPISGVWTDSTARSTRIRRKRS